MPRHSADLFSILLFAGLLLLLFPPVLQSILSLPVLTYTALRSALHHTSQPKATNLPDYTKMSWFQKTFTLPTRSRGSYLVTDHVVSSLPELKDYKVGILHLFVQHTSCALSLNENWDEDVRADMSDALDRVAPEDRKGTMYRHSAEGLDDMPVNERGKRFKERAC